MAFWETTKKREHGNFLYIEEVNSNDGVSQRLANIKIDQTVQDLKEAIAAELKNPEGWSSVMVAFANQELEDLNATLSSFAIQEGDTIFFTRSVTPAVNPPPYSKEIILGNVMFKDTDGKPLILHDIPISWKIRQLRKKLEEDHRLETEELRLLWNGKQLQDEMTLKDYEFGKNCTIHLVMRLRGGAHDLLEHL